MDSTNSQQQSNTEPSNMSKYYAEYKKEIEGVETVETSYGFGNYSFEIVDKKRIVYVQEVYVSPNMRGLKLAAELTTLCVDDATKKKLNPTHVMTTVAVRGKNVEPSMKAILNYGFKLSSATPELIYFIKEI